MRLLHEESLARHTSFRIGGSAPTYAEPESLEELAEYIAALKGERRPFFMLGGGSNTLFPDGTFPGVVISTGRLQTIRDNADVARPGQPLQIVAQAGAPLRRVIKHSLSLGWRGLEQLVGIPGSVGGAVFGNAGAASHAIGDRVESVRVIDGRGRFETLRGADIPWRYRSSGLRGWTIAEITFSLEAGDRNDLTRRAREVFVRKKETQPLSARSAGCAFRNPEGTAAGFLIQEAGLKGVSMGEAHVSPVHANFIVNRGNATSRDVRTLMRKIRTVVRERTGLELLSEIVFATPEEPDS